MEANYPPSTARLSTVSTALPELTAHPGEISTFWFYGGKTAFQEEPQRNRQWQPPQEAVAAMNQQGIAIYPTQIELVRVECRDPAGKTKLVDLDMEKYALLYQRTEKLLQQARRKRTLGL